MRFHPDKNPDAGDKVESELLLVCVVCMLVDSWWVFFFFFFLHGSSRRSALHTRCSVTRRNVRFTIVMARKVSVKVLEEVRTCPSFVFQEGRSYRIKLKAAPITATCLYMLVRSMFGKFIEVVAGAVVLMQPTWVSTVCCLIRCPNTSHWSADQCLTKNTRPRQRNPSFSSTCDVLRLRNPEMAWHWQPIIPVLQHMNEKRIFEIVCCRVCGRPYMVGHNWVSRVPQISPEIGILIMLGNPRNFNSNDTLPQRLTKILKR